MIVNILSRLSVYGGALLVLVAVVSCTSESSEDYTHEKIGDHIRTIDAVAALGKLTPNGEVRYLAAPSSSFGGSPRVSKLYVKEGEPIISGQILAVFDSRERAFSDLNVVKSELKTINEEIVRQQIEVARYKLAAEEGAVAMVLYENKKDKLIQLEGQRDKTKAKVEGLKADLEQSQLISPINGVVLRIIAREGERPGTEGVLTVGANKEMEALIEVYESDIGRVQIGQSVDLISENGGFKGSLFGRVVLISPEVRQREVISTDPTGDADARIVEVRVGLDSQSVALVSNLTGMKVIARFQPF